MADILIRTPVQVLEGGQLPAFQRENDACMDCYAYLKKKIVLKPGEIEKISLGFKMALHPFFEALIRPRSGLALKNGITVLNTPGTIDSNYRGEVCAILINHGKENFEINSGDRVCQLAIRPIGPIPYTQDFNKSQISGIKYDWQVVEELPESERGENGFGSSGK